MNSSKEPFIEELTELFLLSAEGIIDARQFERLQTYLLNSAAIRRYYYDFVNTYVGLSDPNLLLSESVNLQTPLLDEELWRNLAEAEKAALPVEFAKEETVPMRRILKSEAPKPERTFNKSSLTAGILSLAAILLLVVTFQFLPSKAARPVASFSRGFNTLWEDSQGSLVNGVRLWNDGQWYHLRRGLAEITFDSGAKVLIDAPSQFQVISENEMRIEGLMTANVPSSAYGFTVNTSNAKIVDLGTEFGLRAMEREDCEIHVAKGKVEVNETVSLQKTPSKQLIETGQGYRVNAYGSISKASFRKEGFCWTDPSPYEQAVYQSRPLNYWRFDRDEGTFLKNDMNPQLRPENQLIGAIDYGSGPVLGDERANRALRLSGGHDRYAVLLDNMKEFRQSRSVSLSAWIYPDAGVSRDQSILLATNEKGPDTNFNDQIYFTRENSFGFYVYCEKALRRMMIISRPVELNQWHHVVACRTSDQIKLFVDGQLHATETLPSPGGESTSRTYWCIGRGTGHYESTPANYQKWPFTGYIDEISQYNRELAAEEVALLYQAAILKK
jgi:hypothetical protein